MCNKPTQNPSFCEFYDKLKKNNSRTGRGFQQNLKNNLEKSIQISKVGIYLSYQ